MIYSSNYLVLIISNVLISLVIIEARKYKIYWNVPTVMCHKHGMKFEEISRIYGMVQNINDSFNGNEIGILYHAGNFPAYILGDDESVTIINEMVPQKANLRNHLDQLQKDLNENITDPNFSGIGVLDYERWRPVFRQNFNKNNRRYRDYSISLEHEEFRILTYDQYKTLAALAFNYSAQIFFEETIKLIKRERPHAAWGYYDYPKCFHLPSEKSSTSCGEVHEENDNMKWLWDLSDILLPSIYLAQNYTKGETLIGATNRRLIETYRIANKYNPPKRVIPYIRYRYRDDWGLFVVQEDYVKMFRELDQYNIDGLVIWGSFDDVNSRTKCINLSKHLEEILGPILNTIK